ncbi:hypothetical protein ABK040_011682 [Willaertia magna]
MFKEDTFLKVPSETTPNTPESPTIDTNVLIKNPKEQKVNDITKEEQPIINNTIVKNNEKKERVLTKKYIFNILLVISFSLFVFTTCGFITSIVLTTIKSKELDYYHPINLTLQILTPTLGLLWTMASGFFFGMLIVLFVENCLYKTNNNKKDDKIELISKKQEMKEISNIENNEVQLSEEGKINKEEKNEAVEEKQDRTQSNVKI